MGTSGEVDGRFRPRFPAITTATIQALVRDGLLKYTGKKSKTTWPPYTLEFFSVCRARRALQGMRADSQRCPSSRDRPQLAFDMFSSKERV
jgi:hypothetical protein